MHSCELGGEGDRSEHFENATVTPKAAPLCGVVGDHQPQLPLAMVRHRVDASGKRGARCRFGILALWFCCGET